MLGEQPKWGKIRNIRRILVEKQVGKNATGKTKKRKEQNEFNKIDCEVGSWIELANNCV